jgi:hypothetical protein
MTKSKQPNEGLGLEAFDYEKFDAATDQAKQSFKDYLAIAGSSPQNAGKLDINAKYDYEVYRALSIVKYKVNEDTGEKDEYIAGLRILSSSPLQKTRVKAKDALTLNAFVTHNAKEQQTSKYYLLAKPL